MFDLILAIIREPRAFWRWLCEPWGQGLHEELQSLPRVDAAFRELRRKQHEREQRQAAIDLAVKENAQS